MEPEFAQHRYLTAGESSVFMSGSLDGGAPQSAVPPAVEATRSAVAVHKRLMYLLAEHHEVFLPEVLPVWGAVERRCVAGLETAIESARVLLDAGRADLAEDLLTRFSSAEMLDALNLAEAMVSSMDARSRVLSRRPDVERVARPRDPVVINSSHREVRVTSAGGPSTSARAAGSRLAEHRRAGAVAV